MENTFVLDEKLMEYVTENELEFGLENAMWNNNRGFRWMPVPGTLVKEDETTYAIEIEDGNTLFELGAEDIETDPKTLKRILSHPEHAYFAITRFHDIVTFVMRYDKSEKAEENLLHDMMRRFLTDLQVTTTEEIDDLIGEGEQILEAFDPSDDNEEDFEELFAQYFQED